jgi:hypothetical protein
MNYTKPEITVVDNALAAVQMHPKPNGNVDGIPQDALPSVSAYESDE